MVNNLTWLEERRKGIGGSDAPAVLGVSKWKTPLQVYLEKRNEVPRQDDNELFYWGRMLEPAIRKRYADETGRTVVVPDKFLQHPQYPFMIGNVDGLLPDQRRILEVKTARSKDGWGEPGSAEIPETYIIQVQHYMTITAYPIADVAVLFGGNEFQIYEVPEDKELQELLIQRETEFWTLVLDGTPPDPVSYADVKLKWGKVSEPVKVQADQAVIDAIASIKELKALQAREDELKTLVMAYMKGADTLIDPVDGKILATWKASKGSKRFDAKAFQAAQPELYAQYIKESESVRRFLIK